MSWLLRRSNGCSVWFCPLLVPLPLFQCQYGSYASWIAGWIAHLGEEMSGDIANISVGLPVGLPVGLIVEIQSMVKEQ